MSSSEAHSNETKPQSLNRKVIWAAAVIIGFMAVNWVAAVARFQVNGLFSDQWNFCEPILRGEGPLGLFTWQHGPHRQGLAFVLTSWIWEWSGWDTRVEALWGAGWLVVAAVMMLAWKIRLTGRMRWWDLWMPLAALALRQFETVITVPNLSHCVFPLVLLLAIAWLLAKPPQWREWVAMGVIGLIAVFTGFGIFVGGALGWVAGLRLIQAGWSRQWKRALGPALAVVWLMGALGWFLWDYELSPGSAGGAWVLESWWDYPRFVAVMVASRMDLTGGNTLVYVAGSLVMVLAVAAWAHASWRLGRDEALNPAWAAAGLLLTMGLGYAAFTAMGRVHLGVVAGEAPRYTTLMVALWLGLTAWAWGNRRWWSRAAAVALGWSMVLAPWVDLQDRPVADWPGTMGMGDGTRVGIEYTNNQKIEWIMTWEETRDWRLAEARVTAAIHGQAEDVKLGEKIEYLQENRLSFCANLEEPWSWLPWWNPKGFAWARVMGGLEQKWMAEEAVLVVEPAEGEFLNLRFAWKATTLPEATEVELRWGDRRARLSYTELFAGISIPGSVDREKLTLRSLGGTVLLGPPDDMREGSFLVMDPTLTITPEYEVKRWVDGMEGLWPEQGFSIVNGFYGWESNGRFGWTSERMVAESGASRTRFLNVDIESRYGAVADGPIHLVVNGKLWVLPWQGADGLRFSVELPAGKLNRIEITNPAGAVSPEELGRSTDARKLALRVTRLTSDDQPAFPVIGKK